MAEGEEGEETPERIICPKCGCAHFRVAWVRYRRRGKVRALNCRACGRRVTSVEKLEDENENED